jgi:hypothetical protein
MAKRIQFRRGTTAEHTTFVGAPGEITIDTTKNVVVVHNGSTPGGFPAFGSNPNFPGTSTFLGQVRATVNTASTSTTSGSVVITGGLGVSGAIHSATLTTGALVETSSITLKENVNPILNALDSILQLSAVTYDRKDKSAVKEAGFIAEEVDKILPNLVTKDQNGNPFGVQYTKIVAYLVEAIKDQQQQIEELKKKV